VQHAIFMAHLYPSVAISCVPALEEAADHLNSSLGHGASIAPAISWSGGR